eukprot:scaffold77627_cov14-Prasinocladus_malaysianus.AAC.1
MALTRKAVPELVHVIVSQFAGDFRLRLNLSVEDDNMCEMMLRTSLVICLGFTDVSQMSTGASSHEDCFASGLSPAGHIVQSGRHRFDIFCRSR